MKHRIRIVANQTLGGEGLAATVRERVAAGVTDPYVVVPVTKPRGEYENIVLASEGGPSSVPDESAEAATYARAHQRLQEARTGSAVSGSRWAAKWAPQTRSTPSARGCPVTSSTRSSSPRSGRESRTGSAPISLHRVHRTFDIPVTTVTAHGHQRT